MSPVLMVVLGLGLAGLVVFVLVISYTYVIPGPTEAIVRLGYGGARVSTDKGLFAFPVLHSVSRVDLKPHCLQIRMPHGGTLPTKDGAEVTVRGEMHVEVGRRDYNGPWDDGKAYDEDVILALRVLGTGDGVHARLRSRMEYLIGDALRVSVFDRTLGEADANREDLADDIKCLLASELAKVGMRPVSAVISEVTPWSDPELAPVEPVEREG